MTHPNQQASPVLSVKPITPITPTRHIRQQWALNRQAWLDRISNWHPQG